MIAAIVTAAVFALVLCCAWVFVRPAREQASAKLALLVKAMEQLSEENRLLTNRLREVGENSYELQSLRMEFKRLPEALERTKAAEALLARKISELSPEGPIPAPRVHPPSCHWPCPVCSEWFRRWNDRESESRNAP